jgi:hypothetical protein
MMFPGAVVVCVAAVCSSWNSLCSWACRYVLGLPAAFGLFLWRHRVQVRSDQLLRERGEGDSTLTNAHIQVRRLGSDLGLYGAWVLSVAVVDACVHTGKCSCASDTGRSTRTTGPSSCFGRRSC